MGRLSDDAQPAGTGTYQPIDSRSSAGTTWTAGQVVTSGALVYRVDTTHTGAFDTTKATQLGGTAVASIPLTSANSGTSYTVTAPTHGESRLKLTLTGSPTLTLSGGTASEVCAVQLQLIQDATGSRTVTWPSNIDWGINGAPVLSTTAGKADRVYLTTDDAGASWQGALVGTGYTSPVAPSAPTSLGAAVATTTSVTLTWTQGAANGSAVTQNKIYRGTASGAETLVATVSAGTTYTDTGLTSGTQYFYKVSAVNAVGEGAQSSEANATPGTVTIAADTFTGADSATSINNAGTSTRSTPTGSFPWTRQTSVSGVWGISSNRAYKSSGNLGGVFVNAGVADCTVQCDYTTGAAVNDAGLVVRTDGAAEASKNCIQIVADPGGWYIQKFVAGVQTNVAHAGACAANTTYTVKVVLSGSSVSVYINGTLTVSGTVADAGIVSNTRHGLFSANTVTDHFWDNFSVTQP